MTAMNQSALKDRADRLLRELEWAWVVADRKIRCGNCQHCQRERIERGDQRARPAYHIGPREVSYEMGRRRLGGVRQGDVVPCTSLREVIEVLRRAHVEQA